jgi:hypothetical protein
VYGIPIENLDNNLKPTGNLAAPQHQKAASYQPIEYDYLLEECDFTNDIEGLTLQLLELISTMIMKPTLYAIIKFGLFPLINSMCHLMLLSKEQVIET